MILSAATGQFLAMQEPVLLVTLCVKTIFGVFFFYDVIKHIFWGEGHASEAVSCQHQGFPRYLRSAGSASLQESCENPAQFLPSHSLFHPCGNVERTLAEKQNPGKPQTRGNVLTNKTWSI
jgi:hypothetical protein